MIVRWARRYDALLFLLTLGRERRFRERLLAPARLQAGESVLDVGCGTETLAILAKQRVGSGVVHGVDPSPEMIARARVKAHRAGVDVGFQVALAEQLPFPDATFDVVTCTVMMHHLRRVVREQAMLEMKRVLKPGGRVLLVDFAGASENGKGPIAHFHRHGHVKPQELVDRVAEAGLRVTESGPVRQWSLYHVLGLRQQ